MESRIEVTRRLQSEGRWDEASACRDEERMRLRREGLTRRESNERAWAWMIEEFAPLSEQEIRWQATCEYLAMAESPIRHPDLNGAGELAFEAAWWVTCYLLARDEQLRKGNAADAEPVERLMVSRFTSPEVAALGMYGLLRPQEFLQGITKRFDLAIERLEADPAGDQRLVEEMAAVRDEAGEVAERMRARARAASGGDVDDSPLREGAPSPGPRPRSGLPSPCSHARARVRGGAPA